MSTVFYDHLIAWDNLTQALDRKGFDKETRIEYMEHVEEIIHSEVLIVVMEHLPREKHEEFIERFHALPHDPTHLHYLVAHAHPDIESSIQTRTNEVISEIIADLQT